MRSSPSRWEPAPTSGIWPGLPSPLPRADDLISAVGWPDPDMALTYYDMTRIRDLTVPSIRNETGYIIGYSPPFLSAELGGRMVTIELSRRVSTRWQSGQRGSTIDPVTGQGVRVRELEDVLLDLIRDVRKVVLVSLSHGKEKLEP